MISVICECGKRLDTKDRNAGQAIACPYCGAVVTVPDPAEEAEVFIPTPQAKARPPASAILARLEELEASHARMKSWCRWALGGATLSLALAVAGMAKMAPVGRPATPVVVREQPAPVAPPPAIVGGVAKSEETPDVIFAKAFVLRDDDGKAKGIFRVNKGFVSLDMITAKGEGGIRIALAPDGTAAFSMADGRLGENGSGIVMTRSHDGGSTLAIANPQNRVYSIAVEPDKNPQVNATGSE